jgi:hypothetical protein
MAVHCTVGGRMVPMAPCVSGKATWMVGRGALRMAARAASSSPPRNQGRISIKHRLRARNEGSPPCLVLYTTQAGRTLRAGGRAGLPPATPVHAPKSQPPSPMGLFQQRRICSAKAAVLSRGSNFTVYTQQAPVPPPSLPRLFFSPPFFSQKKSTNQSALSRGAT